MTACLTKELTNKYLTSINFIKCFYGFIYVSVLQEGLRDPDVPDRCHRGHRRAVYIP